MTEEYSVGYESGYQAGWNDAMDQWSEREILCEPVAWRWKTPEHENWWFTDDVAFAEEHTEDGYDVSPLYTHLVTQPERKPNIIELENLLRELVLALDNSFISTWQSTAGWDSQLTAAREYLSAHGIKETT